MRPFVPALALLVVSQTPVSAQSFSPYFKVACFTTYVTGTGYQGTPVICSPPRVWRYGDYCECLYASRYRVAGIVRLVPASATMTAAPFTNWGAPGQTGTVFR
jgi:hypothetical protein